MENGPEPGLWGTVPHKPGRDIILRAEMPPEDHRNQSWTGVKKIASELWGPVW